MLRNQEEINLLLVNSGDVDGENFEPNLDCPASRDWEERNYNFEVPN